MDDEYEAVRRPDLADRDSIHLWPDGSRFAIRLEKAGRLHTLVLIGVRPDGTTDVVTLEFLLCDGSGAPRHVLHTLPADHERHETNG